MGGISPAGQPDEAPPPASWASSLSRCSDERHDPGALAALLASETTHVLPIALGAALVWSAPTDGSPELYTRAPEPDDAQRLLLFLGRRPDGRPVVASIQETETEPPEGTAWLGLREVGADLPDLDAELFMAAVGLARWHDAHRRCPRCGEPTVAAVSGWVRRCPADGSEHYPRTDPAVIMAVHDAQERLLLGRNAAWPLGRYSVLAGFVEPGERLEAAVAREVAEEVGLRVGDVRYIGSQPWPFPASLMLGFTARATGSDLTCNPEEIAEARWVTRDELADDIAAGWLTLPGRLSIARRLIEGWYGGRLRPLRESTWGRR